MPSPLGPPQLSIRDPETTLEEPEAARLRFRQFCYEEVTGPREALVQLRELCRRWLQPESCSKEQMLDLLVLEQFLCVLPPEIQAWVRAKRPGSPEEAATLVEGLQSDPAQLLNWITAHILKPKMQPVLQKTKAASDSCHILATAESSEQGHGAKPQDVKMEGSAQLSCSVKEEPSADGQEMASPSPLLPAQSLEGQPAHQEPASTSFHPQRIQEEWELLDSSQKELYWDVMLEKYGTVVSQGLPTPGLEALTESEPRPEQETPILGPEVHRSHMPGMGSTVAPRLEGRNSCKDPPGLSLAPLPPETPAAPTPHKPYTCEQCGLSFDWKSVFVIHNRTHTKGPGPERPPKVPEEPPMRCSTSPQNYTCQDCGRSFSWKSQLVIHRKSHVGKRRHVCGDCGCSFDWKSQLVIHRKSHRQEVP